MSAVLRLCSEKETIPYPLSWTPRRQQTRAAPLAPLTKNMAPVCLQKAPKTDVQPNVARSMGTCFLKCVWDTVRSQPQVPPSTFRYQPLKLLHKGRASIESHGTTSHAFEKPNLKQKRNRNSKGCSPRYALVPSD